jgi:hypothetical protein
VPFGDFGKRVAQVIVRVQVIELRGLQDGVHGSRPPAELRDEFRRRVETSGLSADAYITRAIFNAAIPRGTRRPAVEKQMLAQLLGRSAAIRDALDHASRVVGPDTAGAMRTACEELTVIRAALMKMMERAP